MPFRPNSKALGQAAGRRPLSVEGTGPPPGPAFRGGLTGWDGLQQTLIHGLWQSIRKQMGAH